ncbi:hypothetical protein CRUP_005376 [Coryphaenoides rupestris]|nr:hypothetical protein CRUP_005376 [Coryphaenoides rupestris]
MPWEDLKHSKLTVVLVVVVVVVVSPPPVQVIFALNQTLLQQESLRAGSLQVPYTTDDLIKHYNCGDLNSIIFNHDTSQVWRWLPSSSSSSSSSSDERRRFTQGEDERKWKVPNFNNVTLPLSEQVTAQEIDSYFRQELIYKRNERMGRRVRALMEEHPDKSFFFAFGAGGSWRLSGPRQNNALTQQGGPGVTSTPELHPSDLSYKSEQEEEEEEEEEEEAR